MTEQQKYIIYNGLKIDKLPQLEESTGHQKGIRGNNKKGLDTDALTTVVTRVHQYEEALGLNIIRKNAHGKRLTGIQMPYAK